MRTIVGNTMPHSSLAVANAFIHRAAEAQRNVTHMQVQKLVYLSHGFSLGSGHGPLIEEQFEAWTFGPVIRKLYDSLKQHGPGPIRQLIRWGDDTPLNDIEQFPEAFEQFNPFEVELLEYVSGTYGQYPGHQLSALTHQSGSPWHEAYRKGQNRPIANETIEAYFTRLMEQGAEAA